MPLYIRPDQDQDGLLDHEANYPIQEGDRMLAFIEKHKKEVQSKMANNHTNFRYMLEKQRNGSDTNTSSRRKSAPAGNERKSDSGLEKSKIIRMYKDALNNESSNNGNLNLNGVHSPDSSDERRLSFGIPDKAQRKHSVEPRVEECYRKPISSNDNNNIPVTRVQFQLPNEPVPVFQAAVDDDGDEDPDAQKPNSPQPSHSQQLRQRAKSEASKTPAEEHNHPHHSKRDVSHKPSKAKSHTSRHHRSNQENGEDGGGGTPPQSDHHVAHSKSKAAPTARPSESQQTVNWKDYRWYLLILIAILAIGLGIYVSLKYKPKGGGGGGGSSWGSNKEDDNNHRAAPQGKSQTYFGPVM